MTEQRTPDELTGLKVAQRAYHALLTIPPDAAWRVYNQRVYCMLRDFIARETNTSSEEVQTGYETLARIYEVPL